MRDRKQHENLSEPGREPGDCDYLKNPVSTGLMRNEQKPLSGFVCVFVVVLLFMFLVGGFAGYWDCCFFGEMGPGWRVVFY